MIFCKHSFELVAHKEEYCRFSVGKVEAETIVRCKKCGKFKVTNYTRQEVVPK